MPMRILLIGGEALAGCAFVTDFWPFFALYLAYSLVYVPTLSVANSIAFANLAEGDAWSVYSADPEGNGLEAYVDSPWHVAQPHGRPLDLVHAQPHVRGQRHLYGGAHRDGSARRLPHRDDHGDDRGRQHVPRKRGRRGMEARRPRCTARRSPRHPPSGRSVGKSGRRWVGAAPPGPARRRSSSAGSTTAPRGRAAAFRTMTTGCHAARPCSRALTGS